MNDSGFVSHCLELLAPLGRTSSRRMFGGHALYIDGLCMALIIQDTLYLKVGDPTRALFARHGCTPFTYTVKGGEKHSLGYYTAPEEAMESPAEMTPWARRALGAAVEARAKAAPKKRAGKTVAAKKALAKKASPAKKTAAKAAPAEAAAKKSNAGKAPAKTAAAAKSPAKKAPAKKPAARKAAPRTAAAKKTARP